MCGREREGVWGGRRGEGDMNVVLESPKGTTVSRVQLSLTNPSSCISPGG